MRLLVDTLLVLMLIGVLGGILIFQRAEHHRAERVEAVQEAMRLIQSESLFRAALGEVEATPRGFARYVHPAWFQHQPRNLFVDEAMHDGPWIEHIDPDKDRELANPRQIVADEQHPPFWYNPYHGAVRARVPMQMSQQKTVELYNQINGTTLRADQVAWPQSRWLPGIVSVDEGRAGRHTPAADPSDPVVRSLRDAGRPRYQ